MPELCISIALVAVAGMALFGWLRWMTLAHGRMLSADKSQTFERALTQLETRIKTLDAECAGNTGLNNKFSRDLHDVVQVVTSVRGNLDALAELVKSIDSMKLDCRAYDAWTAKAEQTFEKLSADIDTRDRAITNVAEELVVLKQQQTMALAGVANLPKHGFAGRPKT
jgi:septal ring factor EnvC (AmiA/AmiB activator)